MTSFYLELTRCSTRGLFRCCCLHFSKRWWNDPSLQEPSMHSRLILIINNHSQQVRFKFQCSNSEYTLEKPSSEACDIYLACWKFIKNGGDVMACSSNSLKRLTISSHLLQPSSHLLPPQNNGCFFFPPGSFTLRAAHPESFQDLDQVVHTTKRTISPDTKLG